MFITANKANELVFSYQIAKNNVALDMIQASIESAAKVGRYTITLTEKPNDFCVSYLEKHGFVFNKVSPTDSFSKPTYRILW